MKAHSSPNDPLIKTIQKWKHDQAIISLTLDEMIKEAEGKEKIIEQKVDGQSAILDYKAGEEPRFGSLHGMIMWDLPLCDDITEIFKSKKITQAKIVGEMAGYADNKIIPFNESESLIKNPKADKTKVHWFPYQIIELNSNKIGNDFESYKKMWPELKRIFSGSKYVHPVEYSEGDIKSAYNNWVEKQKNEGIVVRLSNNKIYKVKPTYNYDLVVLAVGDKKHGKNWPKKMISMALLAFMDSSRVFRTAGHVASGFTDEESRELFRWAQNNKVDEDHTYVWVKPQKIMQVQWERTSIRDMNSYEYSRGKYEPVGKKMSGTIVKPRFIRWRSDKQVTPNDLRLTQIPDWTERHKMAHRIASIFVKSGMPEAARLFKKEVKEKDKIVFLKAPFDSIKVEAQKIHFKPKGLWYGCGTGWLDFASSDYHEGLGKYVYKLELNYSNMLKITNNKQLLDFTSEFSVDDLHIDWTKVASKYDGIEICPYLYDMRMDDRTSWYYSWDVASGCIWKQSALKKAELIATYDEKTDKYVLENKIVMASKIVSNFLKE